MKSLKLLTLLGFASLLLVAFMNCSAQKAVRLAELDPPWWVISAVIVFASSILYLIMGNLWDEPAPLFASLPGITCFIIFLIWMATESGRLNIPIEGTFSSPYLQGVSLFLVLCHVILMIAWYAINIGKRINEKMHPMPKTDDIIG